jgi:serine/threonine-protein kinase
MSESLPAKSASLTPAIEAQVDQACDRFEEAWLAGQRPAIAPYLLGVPQEGRPALLRELVKLEWHYRCRGGETPTPEEYRLAFPEFSDGLTDLLAALHQYDQALAGLAADPAVQPRDATTDAGTIDHAAAVAVVVPADAPTSRYRPLRLHAQGGLGEVFLAHDEELHREVALKRIQERHAEDAESRRRFLQEAEITGRLEHPGVVPVYGLVQGDDGQPCYAMRFIEGESLQEAIRCFHAADKPGRLVGERSLALRQLLGRFVAVCYTMAYAHSRGVLHRDLKPANIMLGKYGETLVVDWGMAKPHQDADPEATAPANPATASDGANLTHPGQVVGTPAFMSPEQATGRQALVGPASDLYSLGATLYAILTGQAPFRGSSVAEVLRKVQEGRLTQPREVKKAVPVSLEAVCLKAMALQPDARYASVLDLAADVEHWLADEPVTVCREPWVLRASRWVRRYRTGVTAAAAALVVALVGFAVATVLLTAANRREHAAAVEIGRQRDEVQRQKERADGNLTRARKAVDDYCTSVAADERLQNADLHALRKALLATAVPYYQEFVAQREEDPALLAEQGMAYYRLADLRAKMGEMAEAIKDYQAAQSIYGRLTRSSPTEAAYRHGLAGCYTNAGNLLADLGQDADAEAAYSQALTVLDGLAADFPDVPEYRQFLATTQNNMGMLFRKRGRHADAEAWYNRALVVQEKLVADYPNLPGYRVNLAITYHNLAILAHDLGQSQGAIKAYQQCRQLRAKLVIDFPKVPEYREELANTDADLGGIQESLGRVADAEAAYRLAATDLERLVADFTKVPRYRLELASIQNKLGSLLSQAQRVADAEAAYSRAVPLLENLVAENSAIPRYREELAAAQCGLGEHLRQLGRRAQAEAAFVRALPIQDKLAADFPTIPKYRVKQAEIHVALAMLLQARNCTSDAEAAFRRALAIQEKLVEDFPKVPIYRRELGRSLNNLAYFLTAVGRRPEADVAYGRALPWLEKLVAEFPDVPMYYRDLVVTLTNRGNLLRGLGRRPDATAAYQRALAVQEKLVAAFPNDLAHMNELASCYVPLGHLERDGGNLETALMWYTRAASLVESVLARDPQLHSARGVLKNVLASQANVLGQMRRYREALQAWDRALEVDDGSERIVIRVARATTIVLAGDPEKAAAEVDALASAKGVTGGVLYNAACVHALVGRAFPNDRRRAAQAARRALELLRKAQAAAYFENPEHVAHLRVDPDLEGLRALPEYQTLLADLEKKPERRK